jgi:ribonuclease D
VVKKSSELGIAQEVLATKKDVIGLVIEDESRLTSGWRKSILGGKLQQLITSSQ